MEPRCTISRRVHGFHPPLSTAPVEKVDEERLDVATGGKLERFHFYCRHQCAVPDHEQRFGRVVRTSILPLVLRCAEWISVRSETT